MSVEWFESKGWAKSFLQDPVLHFCLICWLYIAKKNVIAQGWINFFQKMRTSWGRSSVDVTWKLDPFFNGFEYKSKDGKITKGQQGLQSNKRRNLLLEQPFPMHIPSQQQQLAPFSFPDNWKSYSLPVHATKTPIMHYFWGQFQINSGIESYEAELCIYTIW